MILGAGMVERAAVLLTEDSDPEVRAALAFAQEDAQGELGALDAMLALIGEDEDPEARGRLDTRRLELKRVLGREAEVVDELAARIGRDPSDAWAARAWIDITWERDGVDAALELLKGEELDLGRLSELASWARSQASASLRIILTIMA